MGLIPDTLVKNGEERLVVLNRTAISIANDVRGKHRKYVLTYKGKRILKMNPAGVSFEDRQDLLGHRSGRITTHYSAAELGNLLSTANRVVGEGSRKTPTLFILKTKAASA